jgi:hypothetical protein
VRLQPFDDLMLDIVHGPRVGGRPILCAAFASSRRKPKLLRYAIHTQVEKNRGCRAIMVGGLIQQCPDPRNGGGAGSGGAHDDFSL